MTRLMCSKDRNQVEFVKEELFRAGIQTEIRSNPLAAALRVTRVELWLQDESDFAVASRLYLKLQIRMGERPDLTGADDHPDANTITINAQPTMSVSVADRTSRLKGVDPAAAAMRNAAESPNELAQATALLEQEIDALLARETNLAQKCDSLQGRVKTLTESLAQEQAQTARETVAREAAEKKAASMSDTQRAMERELREMKQLLHTRDQALAAAKTDLEARLQESRTHQAKAAELKKELVEIQNRLVAEKESRVAAEERVAKLTSAQDYLEQQLAEQLRMQQQVRAYTENLNSLRNKLQAKNSSRPGS